MSNPFTNVYKELPDVAKVVIVIVVAIVAVILLRRLISITKSAADRVKLQQEANDFSSAGETLSYPLSQYDSLADSLEASMAGVSMYPLDFVKVMNKIQNNLDFLALKKAFGVRDGETMQEWIDGQWMFMSDLKPAVNNAFASRGIKYRI